MLNTYLHSGMSAKEIAEVLVEAQHVETPKGDRVPVAAIDGATSAKDVRAVLRELIETIRSEK
jgi:hypothetical protein